MKRLATGDIALAGRYFDIGVRYFTWQFVRSMPRRDYLPGLKYTSVSIILKI